MENNIDLFGWDTVFAISFAEANQAIKNLKSTPASFKAEDYNKQKQSVGSITGTWGDWSITTDSDGQNILLKCPIHHGSYTTISETKSFDLSNQWVIVSLKLNVFDQKNRTYTDPTAKPGSGMQLDLKVRVKSNDPQDPAANVHASSYTFPDADDPIVAKAICNALFNTYFNTNLSDFKHVFSAFIVNATADKQQLQWLKPTMLSYAVNSTGDLNTSVFGVLAMTEDRPVKLNTHTIDPRLLTVTKGHSAFAISSTLFVQKWILPGLLTMRLGSRPEEYVLSNDGLSYENIKKIQWATFLDHNNKPAEAYLEDGKLSVGLIGNLLKVEMTDLYWDVESGITVHVNYTEYYSLELKSGVDKKGKPYKNVLVAIEKNKPSLVMATTVADWRRTKDLIIQVAVGIIGGIVGGLTGGLFDGVTEAVSSAADSAVQAAEEAGLEDSIVDLGHAIELAFMDSSEGVAQAGVDGAEEASSEISEAVDLKEEGASPETITNKFVSKVRTFGNSIWSNKYKIIGGMLGGGTGVGLGSIPAIVDSLAQQNFSELPSLDEFGNNCVGAVQWPDSSGFELDSATLSGAFILGGNLTSKTK